MLRIDGHPREQTSPSMKKINQVLPLQALIYNRNRRTSGVRVECDRLNKPVMVGLSEDKRKRGR